MKTNKKEIAIIDGNEVEISNLALNMNVSELIVNGQGMVNVNVRLKPYAEIDGQRIETPELSDRSILVADLMNSSDDDLKLCVAKIDAAIQEYLYAKNI